MRIKACIESFSLFSAVMEIVVCEGGLEVVVDRVGGGCYRHVDSDSGLGGTKLGDDVYGINQQYYYPERREMEVRVPRGPKVGDTRRSWGQGSQSSECGGIHRARVLSAALPAQMG